MNASAAKRSLRALLGVVCLVAAALLVLPGMIACGGATQTSTAGLTTTSLDDLQGPAQLVHFATEDGLTLDGYLYGAGPRALVLAHMYPADQTSWSAQAERFAEQGYLVLTFDFRGYGASEGTKDLQHLDLDLAAAVHYLRTQGAQEVVLVGASMGGTASLKAAAALQTLSSIRMAGVATLSAPVEFQGLSATDAVQELQIAMLFIAAERDSGADAARTLLSLSGDRADLHVLPGADHGTDLLAGENAATVWQLLLDFTKLCMPVGG